MARPPLSMGTHGSIRVARRAGGATGSYVAKCRFRDYDGVTRLLERSGSTKAAASRAIQDEIRSRIGSTSGPLRPEHTFERATEIWLTKLDAQVRDGARAVTTADTYRQRLRAVILPAIGQWRLYECTVPRFDAFFNSLPARHSPESRKTIRTVVSLVLRVAVQHEAMADNPIRHLDPIERGPRRPRALTTMERRHFLDWMAGTSEDDEEARAQVRARRRDLPDIVTFMIGTGVRMGEALGVRWCDVDLEGVPVVEGDTLRAVPIVAITGNIVRHRGKGLHRHDGKTDTSLRIVPLPQFVVAALRARDIYGPEVPVFPASAAKGGFNWKDPNNVVGYVREARKAAGMDWAVTSHTFRKTAATIWHDSGLLTDRQKADLTGHAKISTLTDIYVARGELHPAGAAVMDAAWMDS
ncbi:tyrosine-type recombinase/integrase [Pseudonocardia sp. KRD291]|uniref:tyrosine-type recombinase/integrase n=1 Tax=Pseudonocardia sp. KRD291 TaxID=2792007 RepID=UPI001C4A5E99|nr:tyrosine-type recombinase/integrase [Pseudonocardia sp. KRD291]MBW0101651.1 tyrosine-type recombinase/integrase [Pseudonocardia sp. KRD291]